MKKTFFAIILFWQGMEGLYGQQGQEAVFYSQSGASGTALSQSMGGATGAVGGDFSNASTNPAGLGLFRSSELAITPNLFNYSADAKFYGSSLDDSKYNFNISNLHMVLHFPSANKMKSIGWLSGTFAVGYNRMANFHQQITIKGVNSDGSIVNAAASAANGYLPSDLDPYSTQLFWNAYLIDNTSSAPSTYFSQYGMKYGGVSQRINLESSGRSGETDFSFAGNYSNRLFVGASLAVKRIVYDQQINHIERNETDSVSSFTSLNYSTSFKDRGSAVGLRGGFIYRFNDWFRAGISAMIPLDYSINRTYNASISSQTIEGKKEFEAPEGTSSYRIKQTSRFTASGALTIKKRGILSLDYETVNYPGIRLRDEQGSYDNENDYIRSNYRFTGNLRLGGELRFDENYIRAGFQLIGNPKKDLSQGSDVRVYSIGAGYRNEDFYVDAAYLLSMQKGSFTPYSTKLAYTELASLNIARHSFLLTVGTRF